MTPSAISILEVFRARGLGAGTFIHFADFGNAIVWEAGAIKDEQARVGLKSLIDDGYMKELLAGLELTDKGRDFLASNC